MFICNPNNPNGHVWKLEEIENILQQYPQMTLVVDESFIDFAPTAQPSEPLLASYPNLLVIHSMTKSYAIPGLRLGYMLGSEKLIDGSNASPTVERECTSHRDREIPTAKREVPPTRHGQVAQT